MTVIILYLIFCIATSLTANIFIVTPALNDLYLLDPQPKFVTEISKGRALFAFFVVGLAFAPALIFVILSKNMSHRFMVRVREELQKD